MTDSSWTLTCWRCSAKFAWTGRGRWPLFCSPRCRQAAHRAAQRNECVYPWLCRDEKLSAEERTYGHQFACMLKRERLHGPGAVYVLRSDTKQPAGNER